MTPTEFPHRDDIEAALRRVQSGELSPAEATQLLLADVSHPSSSPGETVSTAAETLDSLIDRLGSPPTDVVEAWCEQLSRAAITHQQNSGHALPEIDLQQWAINARGELLFRGQSLADGSSTIAQTGPLNPGSREQINRFRRLLLSDDASPTVDQIPAASDVAAQNDDSSPMITAPIVTTNDHGEDSTSPADQTKPRAPQTNRRRQLLLAGAGLGALAVIVAVLINASHTDTEVAVQPSPAADATFSNDRVGDVVSSDAGQHSTNALKSTGKSDDGGDLKLETFESTAGDDSGTVNPTDSLLSLDALVPAAEFLVPRTDGQPSLPESDPGSVPSDSTASDPLIGDSSVSGDADAVMDESNADSPEESPQTTRSSTVTAVQLPAVDDASTVTQLWDRRVESLTLAFPHDVQLAISDGDATTGWKILDARKSTVVATLTTASTGTKLAWGDNATSSSIASLLMHGRLSDETGRAIYLRPMIEADPWPIEFDQADVRPTWDLRSPIPPRVSRLSIEFDLPDEIEEGWIEPIDPTAVRRTRGLAVLTPKDSETVALGMRLDVRCGRKLSVRVRYAARLAPTMPWQTVSNVNLMRFADQLTEQASLINRQSIQMAAMYDRADSDQRRVLRPQRDQLEAQVETLRLASQRVAELQAMMDTVQASGLLKLRVWVSWPDSEQTLLATASPAE